MSTGPGHLTGEDRPHLSSSVDRARETYKSFPSGVVAVAAEVEEVSTVMIVTSFASGVSFQPPMASFAVRRQSSTWPRLRSAERLGISVLGTMHYESVTRLASRDASARLEGIEITRLPTKAIMFSHSPVRLEGEVVAEHVVGDHLLVVLEITGSSTAPEYAPLIYHDASLGTFDPGGVAAGVTQEGGASCRLRDAGDSAP